jgi:hypothetical protein
MTEEPQLPDDDAEVARLGALAPLVAEGEREAVARRTGKTDP